jgi:hypothetical protein
MTDRSVREARLLSDHADRYPGVEPGVWFIAATLAEHLDLRRSRGGEKPVGAYAVLGRRPGD